MDRRWYHNTIGAFLFLFFKVRFYGFLGHTKLAIWIRERCIHRESLLVSTIQAASNGLPRGCGNLGVGRGAFSLTTGNNVNAATRGGDDRIKCWE